MWSGMFETEADRALTDRAMRPGPPPPPPKPSSWSQVGALLGAPLTGGAQAVNESLRVLNRVDTALADVIPIGGERARARGREFHEAIDVQLRSGADYWKPDPLTSNWASQFLHEGARIVTKVAGYSLAGGVPGAVVGTSLDEGATTFIALRDAGVDPSTAAQVGAVRAGVTAATIAAPVAGRTLAQTAGIVATTGPGAFMAEQALSREILERAGYSERAAELDPFDPAGLALSLVPGAAVGAAVHAARARRAKAPGPADAMEALARDPEVVEAAHVAYRQDTAETQMLGRRDDPAARASHDRAIEEARAALDEERPMVLRQVEVDEVKASRVLDEVRERVSAARALLDDEPVREPVPVAQALDSPAFSGSALEAGQALTRADRVASVRPDLPVRLDENAPTGAAAQFLDSERAGARTELDQTRKAFAAAIECVLTLGD